MQKILRRTALAKAQTHRKTLLRLDKLTRRDRADHRRETVALNRELASAYRSARAALHEDWALGPLSPHRGALAAAEGERHGTFSMRVVNPPVKAKRDQGGAEWLREGDRVCVVEGGERERGVIGRVETVRVEEDMVAVEGVNLVEVRTPEAYIAGRAEAQKVNMMARPIPAEHVRLVYPLPDPVTGVPRDTIINKLVKRDRYLDPYLNEWKWSRYVDPQGIRIPWPDEGQEPEHVDQKGDTLRIDVEDASFLPTLLRPPMPLGVIDELRNKYSVFRDRHDPEWAAAKTAEDEKAARLEELKERLRPKGARNVARKGSTFGGKFMATKEPVQIDEKILAMVGAHMASKGGSSNKPSKNAKKKLARGHTAPVEVPLAQLNGLTLNEESPPPRPGTA